MPLEDVVQVNITTQTQSVARANFGVPLIAAALVPFVGGRTREYASLTEMTDDGFSVNHPAYLAAAKLVSQNPRVPRWKVGRRELPYTQIVRLTPTDTAVGLVYSVRVLEPDGTETTVTYTVLLGDTIADITAGLQPGLDAIPDLVAVDNGTDVTVTATIGKLFAFIELNKGLLIQDLTADPGIATDLAAIEADDGAWYGLIIDSASEAEINAAAAWVEAVVKLFIARNGDSAVLDSGSTTDIAADLEASAFARTALLFSENHRGFADAAWMGRQFPKTPGSSTWAFKTLSGVTVSRLTAGQESAVLGKNANIYTELGGVNVTREGKSGSGEFLDVTRLVDSLRASIQEDVFSALVNNDKIPYTDSGVAIILGLLRGRLNLAILDGGIAADPAPVVTAPKVADVLPADKIARTLPDVNFTATLAGAIHKVQIEGVISV